MPAMDRPVGDPLADLQGPAAVPQQGRAFLFEATWEANAFGIALALHECGAFAWNEFRDRLIEEIAAAEARGLASSYYERWLAALERLLADRGLVSSAELDAWIAALSAGELPEPRGVQP